MNLFAKIEQGLDKIMVAIGDSKKLAADLETSTKLAADLTSANGTLAAENGDLKAKLAAAEKFAADFKAEAEQHATRVGELEAKAETVGVRAASLVASEMGTTPVAITEKGADQSSEAELLAKHAAIKDPKERGEFWAQNMSKKFRK